MEGRCKGSGGIGKGMWLVESLTLSLNWVSERAAGVAQEVGAKGERAQVD